jgi:hypothetical protein
MGSIIECSRSLKGPAATEDIQRILRKADRLLNVDRTSAPNRGIPLPGIGGTDLDRTTAGGYAMLRCATFIHAT